MGPRSILRLSGYWWHLSAAAYSKDNDLLRMGIIWEKAEVAAQNRSEWRALGCGLNHGQGQGQGYRLLQRNQNSSGLQLDVTYWPALAIGSAAQLAVAHCPKERKLDQQSAARQFTWTPASGTMAYFTWCYRKFHLIDGLWKYEN